MNLNWKFWLWGRAVPTPSARRVQGNLVESAAAARAREQRMVRALAGAAEHPIWEAVLELLDEHARNEHEAALLPNLTNEQRQFNAGRSASAYDLALALRNVRVKAELEARKIKDED